MTIPPLMIARSAVDQPLLPRMANRHGLIAGATGTGKTVSLRVLAEAFSDAGIPVFMADVKGDLSGLCSAGRSTPKLEQRLETLGISMPTFRGYPVRYWDVSSQQGHPVRASVSDMGPLLLARLLDLNETQTSVLNLIFKIADDQKLLLIDLKDLKAMLQYVGDNSSTFTTSYGTISKQTIGAIQRGLIALESQGAEAFFGEPALALEDLMACTPEGRGVISLLAADKLFLNPLLYSTVLLWLMSELFEELPEVGDADKPRLVFFFDEAHLLFKDAPKALQDRIEQVVRLIRSKGIGIYFVTQNPQDIPDSVLGQLGNRVQHALRAYTPKDQKAVRAAAETFRTNPELDVETVITQLAVGEALISFLDEEGRPGVVQRAWIYPPHSQFEPLASEARQAEIKRSDIYGKYEALHDPISAYEALQQQRLRQPLQPEKKPSAPQRRKSTSSTTPLERMARSAINTVGRQIARDVVRGLLGTMKKR